jgi:anti-sigma factor ChrR (cupin superfamily)
MTYSTPGVKAHQSLDTLASRYVDVAALPWVELPFPGVEGKILLMDDKRGVVTALVRMAPGSEIPFHEHTGIEQTLMLEGSLEDREGACTAGQYVWRPQGNRHVAKSPNGALMLVMFESPNTYLAGALEGMTMEEIMKGRVPTT